VDGEDVGGIFREAHRVHDALDTAAGRLLLARAGDDAWAEAVGGRSTGQWRPTVRERRAWAKAPHLVLGPDDTRDRAEVAVPVVNGSGETRAVLCASGNPRTFSEETLATAVAPQLVRAARAARRAIGDG